MKKRMMIAGVLMMILLTGCFSNRGASPKEEHKETEGTTKENVKTTEKTEKDTEKKTNITQSQELDEVTLDGLTNDIVGNMTLKQKLGQMFIVNIDLLEPADGASYDYQEISSTMLDALKKYPVGGVIFFSKNLVDRKQTKTFIRNLQGVSPIPMFMAVDEEGGTVSRLGSIPAMKVKDFGDMNKIGAAGDSKKAEEVGDTLGKQLHQLGFNLNFAPVADVYANPKSGMKERCFSADKEVVAKMVKSEVKAMQKQNVSATLKHFPGIGGSAGDTHLDTGYCSKTIKQLRNKDFIPFQAGIDAGVDCVMISHIVLNKVQETEEPSSVSRLVVHDILREELGFQNIVLTDAFNMKAITNNYSSAQAAVAAVTAGVDIVLMPEDLGEAYNGLRAAVKEGTISEKRIDQSVKRIIRTKLSRGVISLDSQLIK